ncbi:hyaluronidase-1-like [Montipora capricornis]|uniref:hyaluronidase-1-like n=1 Tax=Montipora capricornis TaxID=246305 RepID=UPI0035F1B500
MRETLATAHCLTGMAIRFHTLLVAFLLISLHGCFAKRCLQGPPLPNKPFITVWNTPTDHCAPDWNVSLDLDAFDFVVNRNQTWCGEYIAIFYKTQLGLYPYFDNDGEAVNGGLPQLGNLSKHFMKVEEDIQRVIPDPDFQGIGVIDWEIWRPVFDRNWETLSIYRTKSVELVKAKYPSLPDALTEVIARIEFEAAARQFMEGTVLFVQKLRPKSSWGFYGFPNCYNEKYAGPCSNLTLKWNDQVSWLFNSSSALFPSIYLHDIGSLNHTSFVKFRLLESFRHSRKSDGQIIPVYPYIRITYAISQIYLNVADIIATIVQSAEQGAAGVVLWGDHLSEKTKTDCIEIKTYIDNFLGPLVKNLTVVTQECSARFCSSHGRCKFQWNFVEYLQALSLGLARDLTHEWTFMSCNCYNGWGGKNCSLRRSELRRN